MSDRTLLKLRIVFDVALAIAVIYFGTAVFADIYSRHAIVSEIAAIQDRFEKMRGEP